MTDTFTTTTAAAGHFDRTRHGVEVDGPTMADVMAEPMQRPKFKCHRCNGRVWFAEALDTHHCDPNPWNL